ncbi:MAG: leucine-rich repeat domain-containing protein [Bacteroidaceae bacterium]|nr:leucine-rich repeat domain-containing protein [Bacteroidaceae bacterium]
MRTKTFVKRLCAVVLAIFIQTLLFAQTQYDYYDDDAVAGGANRALNGIIIIAVLVIAAMVLLLVVGGILNVYYWFNPKADPSYKRVLAKQEQERKHEEYVKKQRENASPNAVDIGLSVKWASFNLGAYKPSDVGCTFYWAENQPSMIGHPKYSKVKVDMIGDIAGDDKYDAATNMLGKNWRIPTDEECQELLNKCKWETKIIDGIEGRLVTGPNGNSIFLPFNQKSITSGKYVSGHYWTSTPRHGSESANDLRFGENCKQPAEIWCATACCCLFCIRPIYTTVTREMSDVQRKTEAKKAYDQILEGESRLVAKDFDYKYYQEQCIIREEEKDQNRTPLLLGGVCFVEDKIHRDEHGVIYSLDGKRLLEGSHCDCKTYRIKEGTEFVCNGAFSTGLWEGFFNRQKKTLEKVILPSTLIYFPSSAVSEGCVIESLSPNYCIINELLIDTRKKCVVKCLNCYIQKIEIYEPIEEIGEYAFVNCSVLQSVSLPRSIRRIGESAFRHCEMLCSINLPDSIETISASAFFNCKVLHINHLPKNLSHIGDSAFQWCIIDGVTIPECIKEIGKDPFSKNANNIHTESTRFVIINSLLIDSVTNEIIQLVDSAVKNVSIPESITKIRDNAFIHTDIESITIPSSVKEMGSGLFWNCKALSKVQLNCIIERLPNSIFACCSSLTSFDVPECIKVIELGAFYRCTNLLAINLNNGLKVIENQVFDGCVNLVSLNIPESIEKIGDDYESCFKECKNLKDVFYDAREAEITGLPQGMNKLTIGPHVNKLPKNFLYNNSVIDALVIPNKVQRIEKGCIADCLNLKEISIASKDIVIEKGWIRNCKSLRTIKIHVKAYEQILPLIPKGQKIKVKKIYDHQFLFIKW